MRQVAEILMKAALAKEAKAGPFSFSSGLPDCCTASPDLYKTIAEIPDVGRCVGRGGPSDLVCTRVRVLRSRVPRFAFHPLRLACRVLSLAFPPFAWLFRLPSSHASPPRRAGHGAASSR